MFEGVYTALITPFTEEGQLDLVAYSRHIEWQIEQGVDGIVPVGTTGESPTLSMQEHVEVVSTAVQVARGRVKVIAGTGGNATGEAVELTRHAQQAGADGTLQVTPYYNKPSDAGLRHHFETIADIGLPVMLYNVPGRSAKALSIDLIADLAQHQNVVTVKEAGGSVDRVSAILDRCEIDVFSGDDPLTLPMICMGAKGVVSVASNILPREVTDLVHHALAGRFNEALSMHREYYGLFKGMFFETNPLPIKTAAAMLGHCSETFRSPLVPLDTAGREVVRELLDTYRLT